MLSKDKQEKEIIIKLLNSRNPDFTLSFFRGNGKSTPIPISKIKYIEADGSTCNFYMEDLNRPKILVTQIIGDCEEKLLSYGFIRIHRKFLVNLSFFKSINCNETLQLTDDMELPIARRRMKGLLEDLSFYNINL